MKKFDKEFVADLACFMKDYVDEIRAHLIDIAPDIAADPTICRLLHKHRVHCESRDAHFLRDLDWCLNNGMDKPTASVLDHPSSYHDVLNDLLVKDWWHEKCAVDKAS